MGSLTIRVEDLDRAGKEALQFNEASAAGSNATSKLDETIKNLEVNWIGNDATAHINNLVNIQNVLFDLCQHSIEISCDTVSIIRNMQLVRQSNGGSGDIAGNPSVEQMKGSKSTTKATATTMYDVKPEAETGYTLLNESIKNFDVFLQGYNSAYSTLVANWTEGGHLEEVKKIHKDLNEAAERVREVCQKASKDLRTALDNIMKLND